MRAPLIDPFSSLATLHPALPLLGREMEMQLLQSILENTASAQLHGPRAAIVSGESGIGKSRLLEEVCSVAAQRNMTILQASAYESGEMFPYLPFIEALRPIARSSSEEDLRRYTGLDSLRGENLLDPLVNVSLAGLPLITALYQLFPELTYRLQITPVQEVLSPDQAKFRLFDAVATLLERLAQEQPVLLCIDNLQWADSATLELTMYLTVRLHNSRVALLGTTRPPQAIPSQESNARPTTATQAGNALRLLHELMQQGLLLLLPLGPLSEHAAERHIHALLPGILPEEIVRQLLTRAGGNPFFLEELVRTLCLSQQLVLRADTWQTTTPMQSSAWPERITLAVRQRLQGLACRDLLRLAALLGREFPLQPLIRVSGLSEESVLVLIEEALQATLVARISPAVTTWPDAAHALSEPLMQTPRFLFCQGIVQEVLAAEVSTQREQQIHGALGAALEEYYGSLASTHAAELARQYILSDQHEAALVWSLRAGADAVRQQAHREALSHLRTALKLLEAGVMLPSEQQWPTRAQMYLVLGESWLKLGEFAQATNAFHQALDSNQLADTAHVDLTREEPLTKSRANRLLADVYRLQGKYELAMAHLQAAASLLTGESDESERAAPEMALTSWLSTERISLRPAQVTNQRSLEDLSHLRLGERVLLLQAEATLDVLGFRFAQAEKTLWRMHQMATEIGDRGSQGFALHMLGWLRGWGKGIDGAIQLLTQAHELYITSGDPFHAALGDQSLGIIYQALGEMEKARRYNLQGFERARRYGVQHILGWLHCNQGIMALAQGSWEESESHFRSALEASEQPGNARIKPLALQGQAMLSFRRGAWQQAERLFEEAVRAATNTEWYAGALALSGHFLAVTGYRAAARAQLDLAAAQAEPFGYSGDFYIPFLAEGYLHLEDKQPAFAYIERIRDLRGFLYYGVSVARILGKVAALQGDEATAEQAFADGLTLCQRSHNGPEEAAILYEQARATLMRGRLGSPEENERAEQSVHALCERARQLFSHYGMERSMQLVDTLQEGLRQLTNHQQTRVVASIATAPHLAHADYQLGLRLTRRELEVLHLVAEGRTDREVADALVLSPRTVNRHLSNIFVKLDVPGRAAAVAYALRQGLVE